MIDLFHTSEAFANYTIRVWTGMATDEGVGLISTVEVLDDRGLPVCRFEEFVGDNVRRVDEKWPRSRDKAAEALQSQALERARNAVIGRTLGQVHGHRFDVTAPNT